MCARAGWAMGWIMLIVSCTKTLITIYIEDKGRGVCCGFPPRGCGTAVSSDTSSPAQITTKELSYYIITLLITNAAAKVYYINSGNVDSARDSRPDLGQEHPDILLATLLQRPGKQHYCARPRRWKAFNIKFSCLYIINFSAASVGFPPF